MEGEYAAIRHYWREINRGYKDFCDANPELASDPDVKGLVATTNLYIGEIMDAAKELAAYVRIDGLTHLANRRAYDADLFRETERALRYKHPISLIRFDVDKFKPINDTYGHRAGDLVLVEISKILKSEKTGIRKTDIGCRVGGDEFAVILPETDVSETQKVASRLGSAIAERVYDYGAHKIGPVSLSQGIAVFHPTDDLDIEYTVAALELSENADKASYKAKAAGGNCICVYGDPASGILKL
jgi:diguanylate cyclase (GGDEF)-like protein